MRATPPFNRRPRSAAAVLCPVLCFRNLNPLHRTQNTTTLGAAWQRPRSAASAYSLAPAQAITALGCGGRRLRASAAVAAPTAARCGPLMRGAGVVARPRLLSSQLRPSPVAAAAAAGDGDDAGEANSSAGDAATGPPAGDQPAASAPAPAPPPSAAAPSAPSAAAPSPAAAAAPSAAAAAAAPTAPTLASVDFSQVQVLDPAGVFQWLVAYPPFSSLDKSEVMELARLMRVRTAQSGALLQRAGAPPEAFLVVRQGVVAVQDVATTAPDGSAASVEAGPGTLFNLVCGAWGVACVQQGAACFVCAVCVCSVPFAASLCASLLAALPVTTRASNQPQQHERPSEPNQPETRNKNTPTTRIDNSPSSSSARARRRRCAAPRTSRCGTCPPRTCAPWRSGGRSCCSRWARAWCCGGVGGGGGARWGLNGVGMLGCWVEAARGGAAREERASERGLRFSPSPPSPP